MKIRMRPFVAVVLTLSACYTGSGKTLSQQHGENPVRLAATEVALDVVVRDKKGRMVKDLTASDFQVFEDGVPQRIGSFRLVLRETAKGSRTAPKRGEAAVPTAPVPESSSPGVIAIVFDRLSPDARALARKAGVSYAQEGLTEGDFAGVFLIDQSLRTVQSFTDNPELVKQAVERATSASTSSYTSSRARVRDIADRSIVLDQQIDSSASAATAAGSARDSAGASAAGAASGQAAAEQTLLQMESRMLEHFEALERDQQGFASINSLLALIGPMQNLPGRKTIIFFSEGLALPPSVQTKFPSVISAANKANVSIYAIDAAGLRIESSAGEAAREINSIASGRMQQQARGNDRGTQGPYTKSLERNEDILRLDPRSGLGELADETGGLLIHDTNDLTNGLRRIDDDMRAYYLISYVPKNEDYNGRFRHIEVKVNRPNLEVQTRKGYFAVESVGDLPVLEYEAPAIAALRHSRPNSNALAFRAAALIFPEKNRPGLSVIIAEAPISEFTLTPDNEKKTYSSDFSIVALIKDESDKLVQKVSQHYPLGGPIDKLEGARKEAVLFYREVQLPPGRFKVEIEAYDSPKGTAGVRTTNLEVPSADDTMLQLSSVVVLKRVERLSADEQKKDEPLHFGELVVYPNLGEPVLKSTVKQLAFFFTAWPAKGSTDALKLTVEIFQGVRELGRTSAQLPAADARGRIKYASTLPLDSFRPGVYELRVTVADSKNAVSRSTQFIVGP